MTLTEQTMSKFHHCGLVAGLLFAAVCSASAQQALTWQQIRQRFEQNNPTLLAGKLNIDESRAQEITAHLRPNPILALDVDQINPFNGGPTHGTFGELLTTASVSYLIERQRKRELRLESA